MGSPILPPASPQERICMVGPLCSSAWEFGWQGELGQGAARTGAGCLVWHIFLWQSTPMARALAVEEDKILVLIFFPCCEFRGCFPPGICAVRSSSLPKLFVVQELLFPTTPYSALASQECHQDSHFPGCSCLRSLIRKLQTCLLKSFALGQWEVLAVPE